MVQTIQVYANEIFSKDYRGCKNTEFLIYYMYVFINRHES